MQTNCAKLVKKYVEKYAQKTCKLNVEKIQSVYKNSVLKSFTRVFNSFSQSFSLINKKVYTLKNRGFTHFPQTSTITTIYLKDF